MVDSRRWAVSGSLDGGAAQGSDNGTQIYQYTANYDGASNVIGYNDSVMGAWNVTYDTQNRMETGTATAGIYANQNLCWAYDAFGNRTAQALQSGACPAQESSVQPTASNNTNNQVTWTTVNSAVNGFQYDAAGDVVSDGVNQYLYDGEGRLCAVANTPVPGMTTMTGYIYDAEGTRVAKGNITAWSCNLTVNGFQTINDYVVGLSGEQVTEMGMDANGSMAPQHSNVWAAGSPLSTSVPLITGGTLNEFTHGINHPDAFTMTAETLKERVAQAFPDHADAIIGSYRQLYPNANPFQLWSVIATSGMRANIVEQAERKAAQNGAPVYCYQFDWQTPVLDARPMAFHCSELAFVFNNTDRCERMTGGGDAARVLGAAMSDAWVQFARTGDPNVKSLPYWKPFTPETRTTMIFNDVSVAKDNFDDAQLELTKKMA